jgi:hypothetical protein
MKFLLLLLLVVSCPTFFAQKSMIQLNLKKGKTYNLSLNSNSEIFQKINGKTTKINMQVTAKITYKVKAIKNESYYLETQYDFMNISIVQGDGADNKEIHYESNKPSQDILSNFFYQMCRTPFYITMSSFGEISAVEGIDRVIDNGIKELDLSAEKVAKIKKSLAETYGEKAFKGNFEIITLIYPKIAVELNDSWVTETEIFSQQIQAKLNTTYHLLKTDGQFIQLAGESEVVSQEQSTSLKLLGSASINISLNKDTGWIHSASVDQILRIGNKNDANYSFTKMKTTYSDQ